MLMQLLLQRNFKTSILNTLQLLALKIITGRDWPRRPSFDSSLKDFSPWNGFKKMCSDILHLFCCKNKGFRLFVIFQSGGRKWNLAFFYIEKKKSVLPSQLPGRVVQYTPLSLSLILFPKQQLCIFLLGVNPPRARRARFIRLTQFIRRSTLLMDLNYNLCTNRIKRRVAIIFTVWAFSHSFTVSNQDNQSHEV